MHPDLDVLARLVVAGILSAVLGYEREQAGKSAGLRTHMLVGISAALYIGLAGLASSDLDAGGGPTHGDPIRAIQAVAMGIGFLGGGMIVVSRGGHRVHGLTTAASIWATAAVGIAAGIGHFVLAIGATVVLAIVLRVLARFDRDDKPAMKNPGE